MSLSLIAFIGLTFLAAVSGSVFKPDAWYQSLRKPSWQPPGWAFPVVWSVLYAMIAVAGWRVWEAGSGGLLTLAMALFGLQLVLNAAWSWLFMGLRRMDLAFYECLALWASVVATLFAFLAVDRVAGLLFVPYLVWVTVAATLNWTVWRLNSGAPAPQAAE
jgi:translocator protein